MSNIICFIEKKLLLKVNRSKSQTTPYQEVKFLGYTFYKTKGKGRLRVHPKSIKKLKAKLKELTSRSNGWGNERRSRSLRQYIIGWVHYYKLADMKAILLRIDEWYPRCLRMVIWKPWKRIGTKMRNHVKLGINKYRAWPWANTRKSYWHTANRFILTRRITNDRLKSAGYVFLSDYYQNVSVVN